MSKPKCKITRSSVEHMIIRVFNTIKENYSLETARKFYKETLYIRNNNLKGFEIKDSVSNLAEKYVLIILIDN